MNSKNDILFENFKKRKYLLESLNRDFVYTKGSCIGCSENFIGITNFNDMMLCEDCIERIKESVKVQEKVNTLNIDTIQSLLLEYVVFFDMKKMQDEADKSYGGDLKALTKNYKVSAYKFYPDKIDFQTSVLTSKTARLNKLMIDFDGEFSTDKAATQATPDADGTMAPLKVKGKGLTTLTPSQQHSQPTTPIKTTPLQPQIIKTTSGVVAPKDKNYYIGNNTILVKLKEDNSNDYVFTIQGVLGGTDRDIRITKSDYAKDGDSAITQMVIRLLPDITAKKVKSVYSIDLFGQLFNAILDAKSLSRKGDLVYILDWANGYIEIPKGINSDSLELNVDIFTNIEKDIKNKIEDRLRDLDIIPPDGKYTIADVTIGTTFDSFAKDKYIFWTVASNGKKFQVIISIKDFKYNKDAFVIELEKHIPVISNGAETRYIMRMKYPNSNDVFNFDATLVPNSSTIKRGVIVYHVKELDRNFETDIEIKSLTDIEAKLKQSIENELKDIYNSKTASSSKTETLKQKASPSKEMLLDKIAREFKNDFFYNESVIISMDVSINSNGIIQEFIIKIIDTYGYDSETTSTKEYYKDFKDRVVKSMGRVVMSIKDFGIDDNENAFVIISLTDKTYIENTIKTFKLDEYFDLKPKRLKMLFESLKNRR